MTRSRAKPSKPRGRRKSPPSSWAAPRTTRRSSADRRGSSWISAIGSARRRLTRKRRKLPLDKGPFQVHRVKHSLPQKGGGYGRGNSAWPRYPAVRGRRFIGGGWRE